MIKLAIRILPYAILGFSAIILLSCIVTISGPVETEPTVISMKDIQEGDVPKAEWWSVEDGYVAVPGAAYEYSETSEGDEVGSRQYFLPLVSKETALDWANDVKNGRPIKYDDCRLFALLSEDEFKKSLPDLDIESSAKLYVQFDISGLRSKASGLPEKFKEMIKETSPDFAYEDRWIIKLDEPLQKSEATVMMFFAIAFIGGSCAWIVRRRIKAKSESNAAVGRGYQSGIEQGVRSAVGNAIQNAFESHRAQPGDSKA